MESLAFNLVFGFILTCFSPTQLGAEELFFTEDTPTMQDVIRDPAPTLGIIIDIAPAQMNTGADPLPPAKPADEKKEAPIFAAIPNPSSDEIAEWCETLAKTEAFSIPAEKMNWRPKSPLGKLRIKGGANRLNMNLV